MPLHETLDLDAWKRLFPPQHFDELRRQRYANLGKPDQPDDRPGGTPINSPLDLLEVEYARDKFLTPEQRVGGAPVDVFLWKIRPYSEGPVTRLGGRPFRDSKIEWPRDKRNRPLSFVGQISFLDSMDVCPKRPPGDVCLIYAHTRGRELATWEDMAVEWCDADKGAETDWGDLPLNCMWSTTYEGVRCRLKDYPEFDGILTRDAPEVFPERVVQSYLLPSTQATKVGPVSHWIQGDPQPGLVCTLNSFYANEAYPFVNAKSVTRYSSVPGIFDPNEARHDDDPYNLEIGDAGCLYVCVNDHGQSDVFEYCY